MKYSLEVGKVKAIIDDGVDNGGKVPVVTTVDKEPPIEDLSVMMKEMSTFTNKEVSCIGVKAVTSEEYKEMEKNVLTAKELFSSIA